MKDCHSIQDKISESNLADLDDAIVAHINTCSDCSKHFDLLVTLSADVDHLPRVDASDELVDQTIQLITRRPITNKKSQFPWASAMAVGFTLFAGLNLTLNLTFSTDKSLSRTEDFDLVNYFNGPGEISTGAGFGNDVISVDGSALFDEDEVSEQELASPAELRSSVGRSNISEISKRQRAANDKSGLMKFKEEVRGLAQSIEQVPTDVLSRQMPRSSSGARQNILTESESTITPQVSFRDQVQSNRAVVPSNIDFTTLSGKKDVEDFSADPVVEEKKSERTEKRKKVKKKGKTNEKIKLRRRQKSWQQPKPKPKPKPKTAAPAKSALVAGGLLAFAPPPPVPLDNESDMMDSEVNPSTRLIARNYLAQIHSIDNLHFQSATGYWANTYIPGDPNHRMIETRLRQWDRKRLIPVVGTDTQMERSIKQNKQPFDVPSNAALAVYLHADTNTVTGPTRLRLQVGLQANTRFSGVRPNMNVGVVLDSQSFTNVKDLTNIATITALLNALAKSAQPGDQFSLTVTGMEGGTWITPADFRHGAIQIALKNLPTKQSGRRISLYEAVSLAAEQVKKDDNPNATLGSSMILVIADSPIEDFDLLSLRIHQYAVDGVTTSVVSIGDQIDTSKVDQLVLSGQGNRRPISQADQANVLIQKELLSSSRAIARAVRVRIRLSSGVKLVRVINSHRLDEVSSQQVRQAEQSIDRRLAKNLGIVADRGEDEEGIQIVIPHFYAGDSHTILLDVVAEKAGSIADVTVRYKDLLYLKNAVTRANLSIDSELKTVDRLSTNVLKNLLATKLTQTTSHASELLARNDIQGALREITELRNLLQGMRIEVINWANDKELIADETLLTSYIALLQSTVARNELQNLADSLRYVGIRKLLVTQE